MGYSKEKLLERKAQLEGLIAGKSKLLVTLLNLYNEVEELSVQLVAIDAELKELKE